MLNLLLISSPHNIMTNIQIKYVKNYTKNTYLIDSAYNKQFKHNLINILAVYIEDNFGIGFFFFF